MIKIIMSHEMFENDVYPLVKAFYKNETIKMTFEGKSDEIKMESEENVSELRVCLEEHNVSVSFDLSSNPALCEQMEEKEQGKNLLITHQEEIYAKNKREYKNAIKRTLYRVLSEATNRTLPWGTLTGIRPTKIVFEMFEQGESEVAAYDYMTKDYYCSDSKANMSIQIAKRELHLLEQMNYKNGYSLYIGIPFCPSTCHYCSFTSYPVDRFQNVVEDYLVALGKEIDYAKEALKGLKLSTVYIGGGTPTTLSAEQLARLIRKVKENFDMSTVMEFTVEAGRPDSITREKLVVLKEEGVTRISINPQSMQQKTLDAIGRKHTTGQIVEAYHMAREVGHTNINMDLIIGLPGETKDDVLDTLSQIEALSPDSLTIHTLALKRAARLTLEKEKYLEHKAVDVCSMMEETIDYAKTHEYLPYYLYRQKNMEENLENIGYARLGKEGLYNILIMEEKHTILALGAGALSKFVFHDENRIERVENVKSISDYISRIDEMIERKRKFITENASDLHLV